MRGVAAPKSEILRAVHRAQDQLAEFGHRCDVSAEELVQWFEAETPYPDLPLDAILQRPLLVVHELVEIDEVKRMGLPITNDVIIRNPDRVYEAHIRAAEVELEMARRLGDQEHIRSRIPHILGWRSDPRIPEGLRPRCDALLTDALRSHEGPRASYGDS